MRIDFGGGRPAAFFRGTRPGHRYVSIGIVWRFLRCSRDSDGHQPRESSVYRVCCGLKPGGGIRGHHRRVRAFAPTTSSAHPPSPVPIPGHRRCNMILRIDATSPTPPFEQLRLQIVSRINVGVLVPGTRLPTVRALAADLRLAPNTVARAYKELEEAKLLQTRGRAGTFVKAGTARRPITRSKPRATMLT